MINGDWKATLGIGEGWIQLSSDLMWKTHDQLATGSAL